MPSPESEASPPRQSATLMALRSASFTCVEWLLRTDMLVLLGIFAIFYLFKLSTFSISIDDEFGAVRAAPEVWLLQGRWGVYLLERFFVAHPVIPFFPVLVFGVCVAASYLILLRAFGIDHLHPAHFAAYVPYVAFPTWVYALAFYSNTIAFGIGQLCVASAVLAIRPIIETNHTAGRVRPAMHALRAALLAACAIGLYQSFVFSVASLGLALVIVRILDTRESWLPVGLRRCGVLLGVLVMAILLYEAIEILFLRLCGLRGEHYVGGILNLPALFRDPSHALLLTGKLAIGTYIGAEQIFCAPAWGFAVIIGAGLVALLSWPGIESRKRFLLAIAFLGILALPFTLHVIAGGSLPTRTLVAVPGIVWFFTLAGMSSPRRWLVRIASIGLAISALQILYATSLLQTANLFARKHDEALAAAVYARIVAVDPNYSADRAPLVDFYGAQAFDSTYPRPVAEVGSTLGYSFFEWDGGNIDRIVSYMHLLGYPQLRIPSPEQRRHNDAEFASMPIWPDPGSIRYANAMVLIKLGKQPGYR